MVATDTELLDRSFRGAVQLVFLSVVLVYVHRLVDIKEARAESVQRVRCLHFNVHRNEEGDEEHDAACKCDHLALGEVLGLCVHTRDAVLEQKS